MSVGTPGQRFEWDVRRWILEGSARDGRPEVVVVRAAGSLGCIDLVALSRPHAVAIQCKHTGRKQLLSKYEQGYRMGFDEAKLDAVAEREEERLEKMEDANVWAKKVVEKLYDNPNEESP